MLRIALCVIITATAATAWDSLDPVPSPAAVEDGARITWGADCVWGVFPTTDSEYTYVGFYDPDGDTWHILDAEMGLENFTNTSITFQWLEDGVLFVTCLDDGESWLFWYSLYDDSMSGEDLTWNFGDGACIAYQPNDNYNSQMNPVPGWLYCLSGQGKDFYRYAIPTSVPNVKADGIYPGQGAVIADQTPLFEWGSSATPTYRLLVSTQSDFSDTVIDEQVGSPEYEPTTELANGTHYWRSAAWISSAWSWSGTHSFELAGGWYDLTDIPSFTGEGAAMAYDGSFRGRQTILVLVGGGSREFYEYEIAGDAWTQEEDAYMDEDPGTSLTTHDATEQEGLYPWAAYGGSGTSDNPWYYDLSTPDWAEWDDSASGSRFPQWLGPGACMAYGQDNYQYLIVGESSGTPRNNFYRVDPPSALMDGGQASATRTGIARTQVIARYDGVEVEYQLCTSACVRATLRDVLGRQVGVLDAGQQQPGIHRLSWDRDGEGRKLSAGAYFVLLDMGTEQVRLKAVVR